MHPSGRRTLNAHGCRRHHLALLRQVLMLTLPLVLVMLMSAVVVVVVAV
jgi:hypothetical protein